MIFKPNLKKRKVKEISGDFLRVWNISEKTTRPPIGWFAMSHRVINVDDKKLKNKFPKDVIDKVIRRKSHGTWFKITCGKRSIYRLLRFSPQLESKEKQKIYIDWSGWVILNDYNEKIKKNLLLTIRPIGFFEQLISSWFHPDRIQRMSFRLAILSIVIAIISLLISFLC